MSRQTRVIAIANQKGGVGKTTTSMNVAAALVEQGKKVLLVDNDPQGNLTSYLSRNSRVDTTKSTADELYLTKKPLLLSDAKDRFLQFYHVGTDYICAHKDLAGVEHYLFSRPDREEVLKKNLAWAVGEYDFVFIDNPPSINLLTINALVAADRVLIPVQTEYFSLEGIDKMKDSIELIRSRWNPGLQIIGILPTRVDNRKKLTGEVLEHLEKNFPNILFNTRIRDNAKLAESSGYGKTIFEYAPSSAGAEDYRSLSQELIKR